MPFGDKTLVGERGLALSGGQKARLSLARALYHSADIYLLDDPLSAVDTHVAKHIFQKCCVEYLKDKTRVLVTHQIQFLKDAHQILVLNDGECVAIGSYTQLKERGIDLMAYQRQTDATNDNRAVKRRTSVTPSMVSSLSEGSEATDVCESIEVDEQEVRAELKMIGSVDINVYMEYIKAGAAPLLITLTILFIIASQVLYQGSDFWLSLWTNEMSKNPDEVNQTFNIIIYTSLISGLFVSALLSTICFYIMCMRSSVNLYNRIFYALLRSPIHLFESSPIALSLTTLSHWYVKCSTDTESYMTAVERVLEYTAIKPEAELESTPDRKPPKNWPQMGEIVFKDMSL
ncbi:unnamed protein product, partial [Medioppia subpectinata]